MDKLYDSTVLGKSTKKRKDIILLLGMSCFLVFMVYGLYIAKIWKYHDLFTVNYPMSLITDIDHAVNVSLYDYMMLASFIRFLVYTVILYAAYSLAHQNNHLRSLIVMVFLIVIVSGMYVLLPYDSPLMLFTPEILSQPILASGYLGILCVILYVMIKKGEWL